MGKLQGKVEVINDFYMPELDRYRTLRIYLPPNYDESDTRYPVLYMHDAQNLFHKETSTFGEIWDVKNALDEIYEKYKVSIIVVGIDNGEEFRYAEYSPWNSKIGGEYLPHAKATGNLGGDGFKYLEFLVNTLKPYIDSNYKTLKGRENTGICGSSMGGLISICGGIKYQDTFSKIAAFSSAIYFCEEKFMKFLEDTGKNKNMKIYLDVGTDETSDKENKDFPKIYMDCNERTRDKLKEIGFDKELYYLLDKGGRHSEVSWRKRFPKMIEFLFC